MIQVPSNALLNQALFPAFPLQFPCVDQNFCTSRDELFQDSFDGVVMVGKHIHSYARKFLIALKLQDITLLDLDAMLKRIAKTRYVLSSAVHHDFIQLNTQSSATESF